MRKGLIIFLAGMAWSAAETVYFRGEQGTHFFPGSDAERICDLVGLVVCLAGVWLLWRAGAYNRPN